MRQGTSSFQTEPENITQADVLHQLSSEVGQQNRNKTGHEVWSCTWAPDGSYFAWSSGFRKLHLIPWNTDKKHKHDLSDSDGLRERQYHEIDCGAIIWSLAFGSGLPKKASLIYRHCCERKNLVIAAGLSNGRIKLFNCFTGSVIVELIDHTELVRSLDISRDGNLQLISGSYDGTLKMWDLNDEGNMYFSHKVRSKVNSVKFSPSGKFTAAVGSNKMVLLWQGPVSDNKLKRLDSHHNEVVSVDFSPDSALMATASYDTRVIVWDTYTGCMLKELGHVFPSPSFIYAGGANANHVRSVRFSREGCIATVCDDGYVRFWQWEIEEEPVEIVKLKDPLSCAFSHDGSLLAVGTREGEAIFVSSPPCVASLVELSRLVVRRGTSRQAVESLLLPRLVKNKLLYIDGHMR